MSQAVSVFLYYYFYSLCCQSNCVLRLITFCTSFCSFGTIWISAGITSAALITQLWLLTEIIATLLLL